MPTNLHEPMPQWYAVLGDLPRDPLCPEAIRTACLEATAYVDQLRARVAELEAEQGDPWNALKVGDLVLPDMPDGAPCCRAEREYGCTRPAGHTGQHVAEGVDTVLEVWR